LFAALILLTALGAGFWLSALNVRYRDVRYAVPFLIQSWLFLSPVAYSSGLVPARWRFLYGLNPMAGAIDGFRWALLGQGTFRLEVVLTSLGVVTTLFVSGAFYFRHMEKTFADLV
jgi:lipopolysaccharide transport system permease protein